MIHTDHAPDTLAIPYTGSHDSDVILSIRCQFGDLAKGKSTKRPIGRANTRMCLPMQSSVQMFSPQRPVGQQMASSNLWPAIGGAYRDRTDDPLLAKQVLSQLS